jgi:hypothetical protein
MPECDHCGMDLSDYSEVGYDAPKDPKELCDWFVLNGWLTLCIECAERREQESLKQACPSCPDGSVWDRNGPTGETCPTCNGKAYVTGT